MTQNKDIKNSIQRSGIANTPRSITMSAKKWLIAVVLMGSVSVHAEVADNIEDIKNTIDGIQDSISQSQDTMQFVRSVTSPLKTPQPKHTKDRPAHSYFTIESYNIYSSAAGKRMVQAVITNHSGSGVRLKPEQIKAYFGGQRFISPLSIEQDGTFAQGETKSVTLHFGTNNASVIGLITRSY